ncbi:MAG: Gfo/Idh/MocA family oxidoreductase [Lachnospiraceae bacterium]|nr:Gfo/Idh/MocA family oxidoreductase [Lachnospiraceae bacterium]
MYRIGIVGAGIRGKMYAQTIQQDQYAELVAISDTYQPTLDKALELIADEKVKGFSDFREMIDTCSLDGIIVAVPDFLHHDPVIYAAEHKVNILCEKPFSTDVKECEEMLAAVKKNGVVCMVAFENRWNEPMVAMKNYIDTGALGDIINVNARLNDKILVPTDMLKWSKGSSVGWFLFPHLLDLIMWYNGGKKVKQVYAVGTKKVLTRMGLDIYDSIQATVTFEDDTNATMTSSWVLPNSMALTYDLKMEIIGEKSTAYINTHDQCVTTYSDHVENLHSIGTPIDGLLIGNSNFMTHHFINVLRGAVTLEATAEKGVYNTKVIAAIHESAAAGGKVIRIEE